MAKLPSSVQTLVREVVHQGKKYNMFHRSATGANGLKYSVSLFQDAATGRFVNGSYKRLRNLDGCLHTWRQDLMISQGHGTYTYPFGRISGKESVEHAITPHIASHYFYDPVDDGAVRHLFPEEGVFAHRGQGYLASGEQATRDIKMNPLYRKEADEAYAEIERASANRRRIYGEWD